jgi:hypothetical protein
MFILRERIQALDERVNINIFVKNEAPEHSQKKVLTLIERPQLCRVLYAI